ncbi:hypothetical protein [Tessaracoccus lapidicaptus]|uniref:hypothetical protein n=1 Tax=Tessaracoccus lapidicaptus TaxID=1427523 RepID=UPI0033412ED8
MRHLLAPVVLAACVVGACTPAVEEPTTAPPPSPTVSVSASPSPTPEPSPSPTVAESFPPAPASESADQAAVRAAWMEYWRVYEKFAADPSLPDWSETQRITAGEEATLIIQSIGALKDRGWRSLGGREFREVGVSLQGTSAEGRAVASVSYCLDSTAVQVVNALTGEPVTVDASPTLKEVATLEEGADGRWRVVEVRNEPAQC